MMKKVCWMMVVVLTMGAGAQANLLTNGDFNTGNLSGWWTWVPDPANQSITIETDYTYDSTPNAKMWSATSGGWQELGQSFACSEGTAYSLSLVYSATEWANAGINLKYVDASWGYLGYQWITLLNTPNPAGWMSFNADFTTPAGAAYTEVKFAMGGWGTLYVDNVTVVPEPASLLLLGLGGLVIGRKKV